MPPVAARSSIASSSPLEQPTADFTTQPAMDEAAFLAAVAAGYDAVARDADLVCLGEMGIGNTTAAAAIAAATSAKTMPTRRICLFIHTPPARNFDSHMRLTGLC